jgi:hypothetical protein
MHSSENIPRVPIQGHWPQGKSLESDVHVALMDTTIKSPALFASPQERRRTVFALVSASIISLVVWGLVIALNIH